MTHHSTSTETETAGIAVGEQLSALLDDELPAGQLELLVARVGPSREHRARLARYGLIGSTLKGGRYASTPSLERLKVLVVHDLASRVRMAVDADAGPDGDAAAGHGVPVRRRRWIPYAAAAGVALLAIALAPGLSPQWPSGDGAASVADRGTTEVAQLDPAARQRMKPLPLASASLSTRALRSPAALIAASDRASISPQRIASYLVYHGEFSGMLAAKLTDSHLVNRRTYAVDTLPREHAGP